MFEIERKELIDTIRKKGIVSEDVLVAMSDVPRHDFVQKIMIPHAYKDVALPIGHGQTISQPYTVAVMTEALELKKGDSVLEVGTGSGYQAAILMKMGMKVYSIERNEDIFRKVRKFFDETGLRVYCRCSDGTIGWVEHSPFDGIIVTAGSPVVPENLKKQLKINGKMVIPVGDKVNQSLHIITKTAEDEFQTRQISNFAFVPLIGREGWNQK